MQAKAFLLLVVVVMMGIFACGEAGNVNYKTHEKALHLTAGEERAHLHDPSQPIKLYDFLTVSWEGFEDSKVEVSLEDGKGNSHKREFENVVGSENVISFPVSKISVPCSDCKMQVRGLTSGKVGTIHTMNIEHLSPEDRSRLLKNFYKKN